MSSHLRRIPTGPSFKLFHSTQSECGLTYLSLMFFIVSMGIFASTAAQQWSIVLKRDREAELLFRGTRIQHAIEKYVADYEVKKAERENAFPRSLEELTKPTPYLQAAYADPITGQAFELIMSEQDVYGVKSRSKEKLFNRKAFKDAKTYDEVLFKAQVTSRQNCKPGLSGRSKLNENSFFQTGGRGSERQSGIAGCQPSGTNTTGQGIGQVSGSGSMPNSQGATSSSGEVKALNKNETKTSASSNDGRAISSLNPSSAPEPSSSY